MMKTNSNRTIRGSVMALLLLSVLWLLPTTSQAAVVTQLDITGGSVSLNFGSLGSVTGDFTQNGQLAWGNTSPCRTYSRQLTSVILPSLSLRVREVH